VNAHKPLFGTFTVRDAVIVYFMLEPDFNADADDCVGDNPRKHALFEARTTLINFVTNARASSPECAVTRIYLAQDVGDADEGPHANLHWVMQNDIKHVRSGRFEGQLFGHTDCRTRGWFSMSMMDELDSVAAVPSIEGGAP
jgi:hypothetical protein